MTVPAGSSLRLDTPDVSQKFIILSFRNNEGPHLVAKKDDIVLTMSEMRTSGEDSFLLRFVGLYNGEIELMILYRDEFTVIENVL